MNSKTVSLIAKSMTRQQMEEIMRQLKKSEQMLEDLKSVPDMAVRINAGNIEK